MLARVKNLQAKYAIFLTLENSVNRRVMSFPVVPSGLRSQVRSSVMEVRVQSLLLPF